MTPEMPDQVDEIEAAVRAGAVRALRRRADRQAAIANLETGPAGERFPDVIIRTGRAALAGRIAESLNACADQIDGGWLP
jgi:hypothetical protein